MNPTDDTGTKTPARQESFGHIRATATVYLFRAAALLLLVDIAARGYVADFPPTIMVVGVVFAALWAMSSTWASVSGAL